VCFDLSIADGCERQAASGAGQGRGGRREPDSLRPAAHDGNHFPRREMSGSQMEMDDLFGGAFASGAEVEKLAEDCASRRQKVLTFLIS